MRLRYRLHLICLCAFSILGAQQQVPLGLNLPTTSYIEDSWGVIFTHRFAESTSGNGKNLFGLDGYAYSGFGFWGSVPSIPELNYGIYRTSDQKTMVYSIQGVLYSEKALRSSARIEYFTEGVKDNTSTQTIDEGISGSVYQIPTEFFSGVWTFGIVPTYITKTSTSNSIFNISMSLKYQLSNLHSFIVEYYPISSSVKKYSVPLSSSMSRSLRPGFAFGYRFETFGHRFTLIGTNVQGTTAHQVVPGDYQGVGAKANSDWGLAFNIVRIF